MSCFMNLADLIRSFQTDAATENDPVKRMFICDGEFITANIATSAGDGSKLHSQPDHDEIVIVIEEEGEFRVGDETRQVGPGDFIFIPRNTLAWPRSNIDADDVHVVDLCTVLRPEEGEHHLGGRRIGWGQVLNRSRGVRP